MSDVLKAGGDDLHRCDEIFKSVPHQAGLLAIIDGRPVGVDIVSLTAAYAKLHPKLVRSYTLEGLLDPKGEAGAPDVIGASEQKYLAEIVAAEERQFPSVGHGTDNRYK